MPLAHIMNLLHSPHHEPCNPYLSSQKNWLKVSRMQWQKSCYRKLYVALPEMYEQLSKTVRSVELLMDNVLKETASEYI
jgi:hypothetical protein